MTGRPVRAAALVLAALVPMAAAARGAARASAVAPHQCTAASGRWGDVNDDGAVSIIDAQQIARFSVGLSVASTAAVAARGDVTADNSVSILDAQQIARFSVGLSAAVRINTLLPGPTVASLALTPSTAPMLAVGGTLTLAAVPRDSAGGDLSACATVTWSSAAPAVATVSATGVVTAVGAGTAGITAASGSATATLTVSVTTTVPGTTGITVTATAPGPTSRFYVRIDSGGLAAEVVRRIPTTSRALSQLIPLPPASGYRVRVIAVDSAAQSPDEEPLVLALGVARPVTVTAGAATVAPVALVVPLVTLAMPDSVTVAQSAMADVAVRYPVTAFPAEFTQLTCVLRWGVSPITDAAAPSEVQSGSSLGTDSTGRCTPIVPAQGAPRTLYHQVQVHLAPFTPDGGLPVAPRLAFPSTQRGEAVRQLRVRPLATGAVVHFTAPSAARRVYVIARYGNPLQFPRSQVVVRLDGSALRSGTVTVPLPPGADHDLRVVSLDSASWANDSSGSLGWVLGGAARVTGVTVPATGTVPVSVVLSSPAVSVTLPDSVGVGEPIIGTFAITDPADLFGDLAPSSLYSWVSDAPFTRNASAPFVRGTGASVASPAGSRTWPITLPARTVPGVVYTQSQVFTAFESPDGGRSIFLAAYDRDLARQQPLRIIRVAVPASGTCVTAPLAIGDSVTGALLNTDCTHPVLGGNEDRYTLTVTERTPIELRLRSAAFDATVEVRTPDVRLVALNDDDSVSTDALLRVTLQPGSYVVSARSKPGSRVTGGYTLTLRRQPRRGTMVYATTTGATIAMLEPGASVSTTVAVRDTTGALVTPAVTVAVRDDSVARVIPGGIEARARSGATPGTFVAAEAASLAPVVADSIWVLVPRTATGPVLRTDLTSYQLPTTPGTPVTFNVVVDMRGAAQLGAADFDLLYPTVLFADAQRGEAVVTPAPGVTALHRPLTPEVGRISFSYARPGPVGGSHDGVVPIARVTLTARGISDFRSDGVLTLLPGSMVSATLADLLPQLTTYHYPLVVRLP